MSRPNVIAMLMTKNEHHQKIGDDGWAPSHNLSMIEQWLFDISHYVDGIVVVYNRKDNNDQYQRSDGTLEILQNSEMILDLHINPMDQLDFNGARDRQILFEMAKRYNPFWYYTLDADEIATDNVKVVFPKLMAQKDVNVWNFKEINLWRSRKQYRTDKWNNSWFPRLFRNVPGIVDWKNTAPIHEHRIPPVVPGERANCETVGILHHAWVDWADRTEKTNRYIRFEHEKGLGTMEQLQAKYANDLDETGLKVAKVKKSWKLYEYGELGEDWPL